MKKIIKTAFLCILFLWADTVFAQTFTNPKIEKLATISRTSGAGAQQDWAVYGDSLYRFYDQFGFIDIINIRNLKKINKSRSFMTGLSDVAVHCNTVDFSKTFYKPGDLFPLVYVSQRGDSCRTNVYRIVKTGPLYSVQLIQTIHFKDAKMTTTNVDETGRFLWIYNNGPYGRSYSKVKIPAIDQKNVYISAVKNVEKRVRITISGVGQGATIKGGYIYHLHGYKGEGTLAVVDLSTGREVQNINLVSLGFKGEPESVAFHGNDLLIGDHGNFYRLYDEAATNITSIAMPDRPAAKNTYNILGQLVGKNYKGIVICEGKKVIRK